MRLALESEFAKLAPSIIGLEACLSAHFVSRTLRRLGHTPRIIPAIYVKPSAKGQKNDYNEQLMEHAEDPRCSLSVRSAILVELRLQRKGDRRLASGGEIERLGQHEIAVRLACGRCRAR